MKKDYHPKGKCVSCGGKTCRLKFKNCKKCAGILARKNIHVDRKEYSRNWHMKKKYNLEPMEFQAYWQACLGKCFICRNDMEMPTKTRGQALNVVAIDHDHRTGQVRGLLCNRCNKGIGFFEDNVDLLKKAIKYLS